MSEKYLAEGTLARVLRDQVSMGRTFKSGQLVIVEDIVTDAEMEDGEKGYYGLSDPDGEWSGWYVDLDNLEDATGAVRPIKMYAEILVELELDVGATSIEEAAKLIREDPHYYLEDYSSRVANVRVVEGLMW